MKNVYVILEQRSEMTKSDYPRWGFAHIQYCFSSFKKAEKQLDFIVNDIINKGGKWFWIDKENDDTYEIVSEEKSSTFYKSVKIRRNIKTGEKELYLWKIVERILDPQPLH